jgi:cytochrome c-type biogenesis protein CcmF
LALFALRAGKLTTGGAFAPVSRETGLILTNLFLAAAAAAVLIGTLAPLIAEVLYGAHISVGAPYYDMVVPLLLAPMLLLMPLGPLLAWRRGDLADALRQLRPAALVAAITTILVLLQQGAEQPAAVVGLALGAWLFAGTLIKLRSNAPGMSLAHLGVAVLVIATTGAHFGQRDALVIMRPGDTASIAGITVYFDGVSQNQRGPNYTATIGHFRSQRDGRLIARLQPEIRRYDAPPQAKAEVAIHSSLLADLYIVLGDADGRGGYTVHLFHNPLVPWIFLAAALMALGGIVSLFAKRGAATTDVPAAAKRQAVKRQAATVIPLGCLAALIALLGWRLIETRPPDPQPASMIGQSVPAFALAPLEPGATVTAASLKGRVTLVNFFASWCVPCRTEHPLLAEAARHGLRIVGIAYKDRPENTRRFLARLGNPYAAVATDADGRAGRDFGVTGVPESYLVDKNGIVRFYRTGPLTEETMRTQLYPLAERLQ